MPSYEPGCPTEGGGDTSSVFLLKDVSASMGSGQHLLADTVFWRFAEALEERYTDVETTYLLFGSASEVVAQETFYGPHEGDGGCGAAAALERVAEQAGQAEGDTYLLMAGDGFYAEDALYARLDPFEPGVAAHVSVYAGQEEGVEAFRLDLDERWAYNGVVMEPDDVDRVCDNLQAVVNETLNR